MSLLPALFLRGERLRPLGAPIRPQPEPASQPVSDWTCATLGDSAHPAAPFVEPIGARCCRCDRRFEWPGEPEDYDESDDHYCGGSPQCCP